MVKWMFLIGLVLALVACEFRPVAYRDVASVLLDSGKMAVGRRSSPIPQMRNVGRAYESWVLPTTMQCANAGWDGAQWTWKCQAQLPNGVELDRFELNCEEWDEPMGDATINDVMTYGSCGVEYTLRGTPHARPGAGYSASQHVGEPSTYTTTTVTETTHSSLGDTVAFFVVVIFIAIFVGWLISAICNDRPRTTVRVEPTPTVHVSGTAPATPVHVTVETPRTSSSSYSAGYVDGSMDSSFWRPSSWVWGRTQHVYHHNVSSPTPAYSRTTTTTTSSSSGGSSHSSGSHSSGGTHTSSSFGGTKRR